MTFREFVNLERTDEPALSDEQFRKILAAARQEFEAVQPPKRRRGGRRRGRPVVQVEPDASDDFDLAEELR
jgi:hypothetical protein